MLQPKSLCLLLAVSALSQVASAQNDGSATTTPAPTTTRSTLETLASLGQVGLSYLNGLLNPTTQASTPTSMVVATTASTSSTETAGSTSNTGTSRSTSNTGTTPTSTASRSTNTATSASASALPASARLSSSSVATSAFDSTSNPTSTAKAASSSANPPSSHTSRTLAIALGVVGAVLLLTLLALILWCCVRRRRRRRERPDSILSDSDYGEKAIATHGGQSNFASNRDAIYETPSYDDHHGTVPGPAAAVTRKPVPQRSSWSRRSHPPCAERTSRDPFADQSTSWYDGGHHAYPPISPVQQPHERSSWTPPAYVPPIDTSYSSAYPESEVPLVPRVSPLDDDSPSEDDGEDIFVAMGDSRQQQQQQQRRSQHLPPVREEEPDVPLAPQRSSGEPQRATPKRRYSGGSAWIPPSGSLTRPRSTPLSPLAQHPMMPDGGGGRWQAESGGDAGMGAGYFDEHAMGRAFTTGRHSTSERRSLME